MTSNYTSMCNGRSHSAGCRPVLLSRPRAIAAWRDRELRIAAECLYLVERSLVRKPYACVLTTK
jgi:hypothetical protein